MFKIKRSIMKSILTKKKKNQPFDYKQAENYVIPEDSDSSQNNSYYFSAHSKEKDQSLYVRLGLRGEGQVEAWAFFRNGEETFVLKDIFYNDKTSPLKVSNDEQWNFTFEGLLTNDEGIEIPSKINCSFDAKNAAVDFFYHMPAERTATAMAQEKWSGKFFSEVQENNSVHYEQEGVLNGTVTIGAMEYQIELPCLRDHSFGRRVWSYMNNHLWLAAVDNDCMFNFSMVSYPSLSVLEVGHLREKERPIEFVTKASYDRNVIVQGAVPRKLELELEINQKRHIKVTANLLHFDSYTFDNGGYIFIEGIADYNVDGIECRGILEIGFNADSTRYMNGKPIDKIKE